MNQENFFIFNSKGVQMICPDDTVVFFHKWKQLWCRLPQNNQTGVKHTVKEVARRKQGEFYLLLRGEDGITKYGLYLGEGLYLTVTVMWGICGYEIVEREPEKHYQVFKVEE